MEDYIFERLDNQNINDLITLFISSSKRGVNYRKIVLKYDTRYAGMQAIGYLAYSPNRVPVAFYGVIPCLASYNNQTIKIAQATDALTHPDHQRKGLFTKLVLLTYDWAKAEGINFIYGIPNDQSFQVYMNKLKWDHIGHMKTFKWKVNTIPLSHFFKRFPALIGFYHLYIKLVLLFYRKSVFFSNPNCSGSTFGIIRDDEYFRYKQYIKKQIIKLNDTTVWISIDGALKIGDIDKIDPEDFPKLSGKFKRLAFWLGARKVMMQYSPNSSNLRLIEKSQNSEEGLPIICLNLTYRFDPKCFAFSYADIDTF